METKNNLWLIATGAVLASVASFLTGLGAEFAQANAFLVFIAGTIGAGLATTGIKSVTLTNPTLVSVGTIISGMAAFVHTSPYAAQHPGAVLATGIVGAALAGLNIRPPQPPGAKRD